MKNLLKILVVLLCLHGTLTAQNVGIDTETPNAKLDVVSTNSGILIPRLGLTSTFDLTTVPGATVSEIVYNTATISDVTPGFYYWSGFGWIRIKVGLEGEDHDWYELGGTAPDNINDNIYTQGNVSIGIGTAVEQLHVAGNIRVDGDTIMTEDNLATQFVILSNGGVVIKLDNNDDGTGEEFSIKRGGIDANSKVFTVTEAGNTDADGWGVFGGRGEFDGDLTLVGASRDIIVGDNFDIVGTSSFDVFLDSDADNAGATFAIKNDTGNELLAIAEDGNLTLYSYGTATGETGGIRLRELAANGGNFVEIQAPDALGSTYTFTWPGTDGTANQVMTTDGSGVLTWTTASIGVATITAGDGLSNSGTAADPILDVITDNLTIDDNGPGGTLQIIPNALDAEYIWDQDAVTQPGAKFKIAGDGTLSDLFVTGNDITSAAGLDIHSLGMLELFSNTDIRLDLDDDANGSNSLFIRNHSDVNVFQVSEGGNVDINGYLDFLESGGTPTFQTRLQSGDLTGNLTFTLPITDGDADDFLVTDGSGVLSWDDGTGIGDVDWLQTLGTGTPTAITDWIRTQGRVGIGDGFDATLNPVAPLDVYAVGAGNPLSNSIISYNRTNAAGQDAIIAAKVGGSSAGDPFIALDINNETGWSIGVDNSHGNRLKIANSWSNLSSNTKMTILTDGKIGMGAYTYDTDPSWNLDIRGDDVNSGAILQVANSDAGHYMKLFPGQDSDPNPAIQWKAGDPLRFATDLSGWTEWMRIHTDGNVGIGIALPTEKLHVAGDTRINTDGNKAILFSYGNFGNGNTTDMFWNESNTGFNQEEFAMYNQNDVTVANRYFAMFYTADGDASGLNIRKGGNVGVGISLPNAKLDVTATDAGVLIPRLTLTGTTDGTTVPGATTSELVYNSATVSDVTPGYYYWNGTSWERLVIGGDIIDDRDHDWYEVGTTTPPDDITDDVFTQGLVGIGQTTPNNLVDLGTGGIQFTNSEIGNTSDETGVLFFDENYYSSGEAGDANFTGNGGGLGVKNEDGWGALISTANMEWLDMDLNSLHVGGTSDPGNNNLIVDGNATIGGNAIVSGNASVSGNATITGNATVSTLGGSGNAVVMTNNTGLLSITQLTTSADFFLGDGTFGPAPPTIGDNLGNHTATTHLLMEDFQVQNVKAIQGSDWDDQSGGTDNNYRLLFRDGAHMFYNGGVAVGQWGNGTWGDLQDGRLIVKDRLGVGAINPAAVLDVEDTDGGILIPRIALLATNNSSPVSAPVTSEFIYNTATAGTDPYDVSPGYYYWDGLAWARFMSDSESYWTRDNTNGYVYPTTIADKIGINTATPQTTLDVNGTILAGGDDELYHHGLAANGTELDGEEVFVIPGPTSDYIIGVQDGNGRIQHKWNATWGTSEKFLVDAEDAFFMDITAAVSGTASPYYEIKHAEGDAAAAGDAITWESHLSLYPDGRMGVGVDNTSAEASAILDVKGTDGGFLAPRVTIAQRDAISSPAEGLLVFNTENDCFEFWDTRYSPGGAGGFWNSLCQWCEEVVIISSNQTGYNMNTAVTGKAKSYCVYVNSGVTLQASSNGSSNGTAGNPGFDASTMPSGASITLFNSGTILAGGANGGRGGQESDAVCTGDANGTNGGQGGHAILTSSSVPVRVINYGSIHAGGGGGGGGGAACCAAGGGGGGGAGTPGGSGGGNNTTQCASGLVCTCGSTSSSGGNAGGSTTGGTGGGGANRGATACTCDGNGAGSGGTGGGRGIAGFIGNGGQRLGSGGAAGYALNGNGSGSSLSNQGGTVSGSVVP